MHVYDVRTYMTGEDPLQDRKRHADESASKPTKTKQNKQDTIIPTCTLKKLGTSHNHTGNKDHMRT